MKPVQHRWKWMVLIGLWGSLAHATDRLDSLEVSVWNAGSRPVLQQVEKQLIHTLGQGGADTAHLYYLLSLTYLHLFMSDSIEVKLLQQALQLAQEAIELQPDSEGGYLAMSEMLSTLGKKPEALFLLHTLEANAQKKQKPKSWRLRFHLARIQSQDPASLASTLEALLQENPSPLLQNLILPDLVAALQLSQPEASYIKALQQLEVRFPHPLLRHKLVSAYLAAGQVSQAQQLCQRGLQQDPRDIWLQIHTQVIRYRFLHQSETAYHHLLALETLTPDGLHSLLWMHMGLVQQQMRHKTAAYGYMQKALEQNDFSPEFLEEVHQAYIHVHQEPAFLSLLEHLQEEASNHTALYGQLGRTASHLKRYPEALGWYNQGLLLDPEEATFHYNKSCVLALQGKEREALHWLQQALELRPDLSMDAQHDTDFISIQHSDAFQALILHSTEKQEAKAAALADTTMPTPPAPGK